MQLFAVNFISLQDHSTCFGCLTRMGDRCLQGFSGETRGERDRSEDIEVDNIKMNPQRTGEDSVDCIDLSEDREK